MSQLLRPRNRPKKEAKKDASAPPKNGRAAKQKPEKEKKPATEKSVKAAQKGLAAAEGDSSAVNKKGRGKSKRETTT